MALPNILRADFEMDVRSYHNHKSLHSRNDEFPVFEIDVAGKETAPQQTDHDLALNQDIMPCSC
jgi:hypothetical protein